MLMHGPGALTEIMIKLLFIASFTKYPSHAHIFEKINSEALFGIILTIPENFVAGKSPRITLKLVLWRRENF